MRDLGAVAVAVAVALGAWVARPAPVVAAGALAALSVLARRPAALCICAAVLASGLSALAVDGLAVATAGDVRGAATLVTDPERRRLDGAVVAEARVRLTEGERRVQLVAAAPHGGVLASGAAGERYTIHGTLRPLADATRRHLHSRHVVARVQVERVEWRDAGALPDRVANRVRDLLERGAASMADGSRSLFLGFVLGDDRGQPDAAVDDFRASGLSHLLAVSGQNLAFVLLLIAPVVRRLPLPGRIALAATVVLGFGLLTRWEPSVLRAVAMAGVGLSSRAAGRPITRVRSLALAVSALVLIDPLLVRSLGFGLSVGACAGIAVLAPLLERALEERVPWAAPRAALSMTLAAQAGVAPLQLLVFGPVPVVSIPANLLAAPAAGPVVLYGMTAGLLAGALGDGAASAIHAPTSVLVGWITAVARVGAALPLGGAGAAHIAVTGAAVALAAVATRSRVRSAALGIAILVLAAPGVATVQRAGVDLHDAELAPGVRLWRSGGVTVAVVGADRAPVAASIAAAARAHGLRGLSAVVCARGTPAVAAAVAELRRRTRVVDVLVPAGAPLSDVTVVASPVEIRFGRLVLALEPAGSGRLAADVRVASPP